MVVGLSGRTELVLAQPLGTAPRRRWCALAARDRSATAALPSLDIAAPETLERTPDMLDVLKEAGVVDAGGAGFVLFLDAMLHVVAGRPVPEPQRKAYPELPKTLGDGCSPSPPFRRLRLLIHRNPKPRPELTLRRAEMRPTQPLKASGHVGLHGIFAEVKNRGDVPAGQLAEAGETDGPAPLRHRFGDLCAGLGAGTAQQNAATACDPACSESTNYFDLK